MKSLALAAAVLVFATTRTLIGQDALAERATMPTMAERSNEFALDLYKRLAGGEQKNIFFSPTSIHTALAMAYVGARGQTAAQMAGVMHLPPGSAPDKTAADYSALLEQVKAGEGAAYELHTANALWGQRGYPWLGDFLQLTREPFAAPLREVDYRTAPADAAKQINTWVEKETRDKIKDLIKPDMLTEDTRLVLANAIYFKGTWMHQFNKNATRDADFRTGGKTVKVPMMFQEARFGYTADEQVQVLSMPYKGDDLSMLVVLSRKDDGLAEVAKDLTAEKLAAWVGKARVQKVRAYMPRFKMTEELSLASTLSAMGMKDAFRPGAADFSGMDGQRELFISAVAHKAFVDVNEEGTEAAAATGLIVSVTSAQVDEPPTFRADHPFLFAIRHNATGALLFLGQVVDPK